MKGVDGFREVENPVSEDGRTRLEGKGFFVIHVDARSGRIVVEHYSYSRRIKNKFVGSTAKSLCDTIVRRGLIADASHAAYLGRELMKAEVSLKAGLKYVQDRGFRFS
jgi:tetrahydromethanopterin S-methyltransferase subunit A